MRITTWLLEQICFQFSFGFVLLQFHSANPRFLIFKTQERMFKDIEGGKLKTFVNVSRRSEQHCSVVLRVPQTETVLGTAHTTCTLLYRLLYCLISARQKYKEYKCWMYMFSDVFSSTVFQWKYQLNLFQRLSEKGFNGSAESTFWSYVNGCVLTRCSKEINWKLSSGQERKEA